MLGLFDNLGTVVRAKRDQIGLTQKDLAKAIGVSPATLNKWEKGRSRVSRLEDLEKLAEVLGWNSLCEISAALGEGPDRIQQLEDRVAALEAGAKERG